MSQVFPRKMLSMDASKDDYFTRIRHGEETTSLLDDLAPQGGARSDALWPSSSTHNNDVRIRYQSVNLTTTSNKSQRRLSFIKRRQWNTTAASATAPRTSTLAPWLTTRFVVLLLLLLIPSLQAGLLLPQHHQHDSIFRWKRPQQARSPSFVSCRRPTSIIGLASSSSLYAARSGGAAAAAGRKKRSRSIATDDLTALKESVDIVSVVESYNLPAFQRTVGHSNRAVCLCPFHDDHSPSLKIDGERRIYKCFACGAGGDVYQFVRQYNNQVLGGEEMTFYQAVRYVSKNFGEHSVAANNILSSTSTGKRMSDEERKGLDKRKERILLANSAAAAFYSSCLTKPDAGGARYHLCSRALSVSTMRTFAMGYAPDAYFSGPATRIGTSQQEKALPRKWGDESLVQHLKSLGFTANEILDAGLAIQTKRGLAATSTAKPRSGSPNKRPSNTDNINATTEITGYDSLIDRFRHRIMVPIFDSTGKNVIAFGGREIPSLEEETITVEVVDSSPLQWQQQRQQEFKGPKYLNSPESPVFQKSHILFGQHLANAKINEGLTTLLNRKNDAKGSTASSDSLILVEGYMDVISLHTAGVNGVVASMGTAVTIEQLTLAAKLAISRRRALSGNAVNGGRLVLCLDNDAAGEATVERLCSQGMLVDAAARVQNAVEIVIATLPKGMKDPADFVEARLLSNDDDKDTAETKEQLAIDFHALVLENAQEWTDWYLQRLLNSFEPKALQGRPGSLGNVFDSVARFLATSMDTAGRTQKAYEIAGSFAATISNSTSAESSSSVRNQLETDLIRRAAKIADETEASKSRLSRGYQQQPHQGGMLATRNGHSNAATAVHGEGTDRKKRNGTRTAATPKRKNGRSEPSPRSEGQMVSRDRASVPLTAHIDGTFQCNKPDGDWMGLTKEGRLEPPLGFDPQSTIENQLHEALIQVQCTTAAPPMTYSQRRDARRTVYHNSNAYHGETFLTQQAELAGYTKGNINLQKYPELFKNGVASLLIDVDPLLSLRNAEDAVLKALVSNGSARTIAKDWLDAKNAVNANMVDLKWTAPDKEWLFTCLVNEMDSIPHTCNNDPRKLRMFLSNRTDCPLTAFVTAEEDTTVEQDLNDDKPPLSSRLHERTSVGTLDTLFFRDNGLPVDLTDGTRLASIDLYMQEILGAHVLASTSCHAKVVRDELTHVGTSLDRMNNGSNNSSDAITAQGVANETTTQGEQAELAMRFQELTTELRDVTATSREMKESMNRVNSRLMREKPGLVAEGRMSINAQMKLADEVDKFEHTQVVSPSIADDDRYLPTDSVSKEPLDDELQRIDEEFGEWANEDYVWTSADAEKDLRKNSHLYLMEMQEREEQRYGDEMDNPQ